MGRVVWKQAEYEKMLAGQIIAGLTAIGEEAKAFVRRATPFLTGYARRSVYFVVLDERGNVVAGDKTDDNGVAVPRSFPGSGYYRTIVGANAPYYIWIEIGSRGRAGKQALARAVQLISARTAQAIAEAKRGGGA